VPLCPSSQRQSHRRWAGAVAGLGNCRKQTLVTAERHINWGVEGIDDTALHLS